jgi:hypothetical protein
MRLAVLAVDRSEDISRARCRNKPDPTRSSSPADECAGKDLSDIPSITANLLETVHSAPAPEEPATVSLVHYSLCRWPCGR